MASIPTAKKTASATAVTKTTVAKKAPLAKRAQRQTPAQSAAAPSAKTATPKPERKKDKPEKVKVVRDSFTIPKTEFAQIASMKKRAMALGVEIKKSELIRAGLTLLAGASDTAFRRALGNVPTLKTGRPGKA